ncbi:MAG: ABC transporter ATP-binding protein [Elusimicrobia bacterium]|nr:ABC transporter ATP-binding protein [Elusimicrobiota bacterium]
MLKISDLKSAILLKGLALLALILFPLLVRNTSSVYLIRAAGTVGLYILLALGLNFTLGCAGLFDLGYIAFYALGAYTAAIGSIHGFSFWFNLVAAVAVSVSVRLLVGISILRLRGDYLAIVTMGFGEITRLTFNNLDFLTNGPKGLPRVGESIQAVQIFGYDLGRDPSNMGYYYLILIAICVAAVLSKRLEDSRWGRAWVAIREDEIAAELSGLPVAKLKLLAFTISSVFAGAAGAIFAHWERFVTPESFVFWESILIVAMIVLGGMGSIPGAILGAVLLAGSPQLLQASSDFFSRILGAGFINYRYLIFGLIMVFVVTFRPQGLLPSKRRRTELEELRVQS